VPPKPPHPDLRFRLEAEDGRARAAVFATPHGAVETPCFMPVATRASLKGLTNAQLAHVDPEVLLANTYHLHLRPGEERIRALGGLHGFAGWDRPLLTDSGGYQVFSLGTRVRVREDGVLVQSHLDGELLFLGPRESMGIQEALGADLVMAFDHCVGLPADRAAVEAAVHRTTAWARACAAARTRDDQALFGIVQGGTDEELRALSARDLAELDLPGYAIGGLAVGEGREALWRTVASTAPLLPAGKPRYLMGVGTPPDLLAAVAAGVDLFDCVLPTRGGRRGHLYTHDGPLRIASRRFEGSEEPLDDACGCETCRTHSRAYLRHLFAVGEHSATTLGTLHNVTFFVELLCRARAAIRAGSFAAFRSDFLARYEAGERRWQAEHEADPEGAAGSRRARAERADRRRRLDDRGA
jgi:queuine tRNA-ribosyltransferase